MVSERKQQCLSTLAQTQVQALLPNSRTIAVHKEWPRKSRWRWGHTFPLSIPRYHLTKPDTPEKTSTCAQGCPVNCPDNALPPPEVAVKDQGWMFTNKCYTYSVCQTQIPGEYEAPVLLYFGSVGAPRWVGGRPPGTYRSAVTSLFSAFSWGKLQLFPKQLISMS